MRIRPATLKDCKTCFDMSNIPELLTPQGKPVPIFWFAAMVREKQMFFVAEEKNKIVGYIFGERTAGDVAFAHMIAVMPAHRGKGISTQLLDAFETECRRRKLHAIVGYHYEKSKAIHALLENHGYECGSLVREFSKPL